MDGVALKLFNMSLAAGWLVLAAILFRLLFRKAPKWILCLAWGLVGLRLLLPFTVQSPLSLVPSEEPVRMETSSGERRAVFSSGIPALDAAVNPAAPDDPGERAAIEEKAPEAAPRTGEGGKASFPVFGTVWAAGCAGMLLYAFISFLLLKKQVGAAIPREEGIYIADGVKSPFILGVFRPKIYLPPFLEEETAGYVIAHEKAHLQRKDHWWKPLGWLLLSVYWFNPLLWVAYILLSRDIEFACDEKVIRDLDREKKAGYSAALLRASGPQRRIAVCPLAFGEVGVKKRIKSVFHYKKPAFWIVIAAALALCVTAVCFLTGPMRQNTGDTALSDGVRAALEKSIPGFDPDRMMGNDENLFSTGDYVVLGSEEKGNETAVYLWIYYATYEKDGDDGIREKSASHIPTAVTLRKVLKGESEAYVLAEFWEPRDGGYFTEDIKGKFPRALWKAAFDSQTTVGEQSRRCGIKAAEWFAKKDLTVDGVIALSEEIGEDLTWGDFADYRYEVTGSGMFIRLYRMEEDFSLWVAGTAPGPDPESKPSYVYLFHGDTWLQSTTEADWVDVRTGDVRAFVKEIRDEKTAALLEAEAEKEAALLRETWEAERERAKARYAELEKEKAGFESSHDMDSLTGEEQREYHYIREEMFSLENAYLDPPPEMTPGDELTSLLYDRIYYYKELSPLMKKYGKERVEEERYGESFGRAEDLLVTINYLTLLERRYQAGEDPETLLSAWNRFRVHSYNRRETGEKDGWWEEAWNGGVLLPYTVDGRSYPD